MLRSLLAALLAPQGNRLIMILFLVGAGILTSCRGSESKTSTLSQPPIILISIDTLRSDRLPAYGYEGVSTPNIDALRHDGILYTHAYSHAPLTAPSHATILTGRLPADTGIRDNGGFHLKPEVSTLAELLKHRGYSTGGAVSSIVLVGSSFSKGFDFFEDSIERTHVDQGLGREQRSGRETIAIAKTWLQARASDRVFFLLHLYEPHTPYDPPEPYRSAAADRYDGEVAYVDSLVGEFLNYLRDAGLYEPSMIILLSDHGEGLGDHGEDEHGLLLNREAIQVPMIVKLPGARDKGRTIEEPVQLIDVFPTVAEASGSLETPATGARSLLSFLREKGAPRRIYSESYYARIHFGWSDLHSLIDGAYHYIHSPAPELFDLRRDVRETTNAIAEQRRVYTAWRREIESLIQPLNPRESISAEEAAKLAALGYLGSTNMADDATLEDPKSQIETFRRVKRAYSLFHDEKLAEALAEFDRILADNPRMADAWALKMMILSRTGRPEEAIEAGRRVLQLSPTSAATAITMGTIFLQMNRLDEAALHAELAVAAETASAHELLGRISLAAGKLAEAESHAHRSLEAKPDQPLPLMILGAVQLEKKNAAEALKLLDRAAEIVRAKNRPEISLLNFMRGDALARLGRNAEAEAAFKEEIRFVPHDPRAYTRLMLLYFSAGRHSEAAALGRQLIEKAPRPESYLALVETLRIVGDREGATYWARAGAKRFPNHPLLRKVAEQRL